MSDETNEEATALAASEEASAPAEAPAVDVPAHARFTYHVASNLEHDRVKYPIGGTIPGSLLTVEQFKVLRKDGILKYASEVADAAKLSADALAKEQELAEVRAQVEQLKAQLAAAQKASKKL